MDGVFFLVADSFDGNPEIAATAGFGALAIEDCLTITTPASWEEVEVEVLLMDVLPQHQNYELGWDSVSIGEVTFTQPAALSDMEFQPIQVVVTPPGRYSFVALARSRTTVEQLEFRMSDVMRQACGANHSRVKATEAFNTFASLVVALSFKVSTDQTSGLRHLEGMSESIVERAQFLGRDNLGNAPKLAEGT